MSYAVDFGTSNTVIARWNPVSQQPESIALPGLSFRVGQNPDLVPSLVYVEQAATGQVLVGQQVRDRGLDLHSDPRFFRSFKRGIGADIQGFLPELDGCAVSFEQVGRWFLLTLLNQLKASQPDLGESLVVTVPVDSFESYRHWLGQVCADLQIEQIRMIDEPTAAALGYGKADQSLLLVLDFGGGTLDLSLVQLSASKPLGFILKWGDKMLADSTRQRPQTARVLAKAGQNLGGTDLDHWLVDYFSKTQDLGVTPLTTRLAERLKIQLSLQPKATEVYFNAETFDSIEMSLDRNMFEEILVQHQFFERLDASMTQVLQQARRQGITVEDIESVLLVGGTSQIPAVKTWVQQYFEAAKVCSSRPFEAIAQGALQLTRGIELKDFLYHGYGVRYWDRRQNAHGWHPIIPEGQPYPMADPVELVLGASNDGQPSIELVIGELGSNAGGTEVYFDGDRLVTRTLSNVPTTVQALNDREGARSIAKLTPPGYPGCDRIKVQFWVDETRALRITVEDLLVQTILIRNQVVAQLS
ncbi:Hsp70 family protein [Synechococcales cyanobacterium C]|uniref:Hsp70 family protein n=1 Tax=Petrachloros mirabilis ULC683 TaxID=2781853 RepID=A0A8K2A8E5_9CYAN|nr:Hsp70 family protein [Petrachloros mirabilis]NCJ07939.1 Hsp70 family protein [Petrachloros mirabilis ULC683]